MLLPGCLTWPWMNVFSIFFANGIDFFLVVYGEQPEFFDGVVPHNLRVGLV